MRARVYDRDHLDTSSWTTLRFLARRGGGPRCRGRQRIAGPAAPSPTVRRGVVRRWRRSFSSRASDPRERRPARHGQREGILRLRRRCGHRARRRPPPTAKATIKMPTAGWRATAPASTGSTAGSRDGMIGVTARSSPNPDSTASSCR